MSAAHTPWPWLAQPGDNFITDKRDIVICEMHRHHSDEQVNANAHLIAAAPDLLAALQAIVKSLADQDDEGLIEHAQQMIDARAAIAKATGGAL